MASCTTLLRDRTRPAACVRLYVPLRFRVYDSVPRAPVSVRAAASRRAPLLRCTHIASGRQFAAKVILKHSMKLRDRNGAVVRSQLGDNDAAAMAAVHKEVGILDRLQRVPDRAGIIAFYGAYETHDRVAIILECAPPNPARPAVN